MNTPSVSLQAGVEVSLGAAGNFVRVLGAEAPVEIKIDEVGARLNFEVGMSFTAPRRFSQIRVVSAVDQRVTLGLGDGEIGDDRFIAGGAGGAMHVLGGTLVFSKVPALIPVDGGYRAKIAAANPDRKELAVSVPIGTRPKIWGTESGADGDGFPMADAFTLPTTGELWAFTAGPVVYQVMEVMK